MGTHGDNLTVLFSEQSRHHHTGAGHPERAARMDATLEGVRRAGAAWRAAKPPDPSMLAAALQRVHGSSYIENLAAAVSSGASLFHSADNPISPGSNDAALGAVAAGLEAAELVSSGQTRRAFVVARPPGHHAERERAMGFCFFNTIACIAETLRATGVAERIAVVDFDVHHGNGTQSHFWRRNDVLFASIHQWPFYPGTGGADERGAGEGEGATINVPLAAGATERLWLREFERQIVVPLDAFAPQIILISAGFDAHELDPLGGMNLTGAGYGEMTRLLRDIAERHAGGRMISLIEGGYDLEGLASGVAAHVMELMEG